MNWTPVKNVELFEHYMAFVFESLYDKFPLCVDIETNHLYEKFIKFEHIEVMMNRVERDEAELKQILAATLFWLRDNNLISFKGESSQSSKNTKPRFSCVVLTSKGLSLLHRPIESLERNPSVIDNIKDALENGLYDKIRASVGIAIDMLA